MSEYYHYTSMAAVKAIVKDGMFANHPLYTTDRYFNAHAAGDAVGVMPHNIDCALLFKDDGFFKPFYPFIVPATNRFAGGARQYQHAKRLKPIAVRKIGEHMWQPL